MNKYSLDRVCEKNLREFLKKDKNNAYFSYYNDKSVTITHSQISKVKITPYRYIFYLADNEKVYLTRIIGPLQLETTIMNDIKNLYEDKFVY